MVFEHIDYRLIYMNGKHPDDIAGLSGVGGTFDRPVGGRYARCGYVGVREESWLDSNRFAAQWPDAYGRAVPKTSPDTYIWKVTIEDPVYFTKPFTYAFNVVRDEYRVMPDRCADTPPDDKYVKISR